MDFPTVDQFKERLLTDPLEQIVQVHIIEGLPFVFRRSPRSLDQLRGHLSQNLGCPAQSILVVGSGKLGFSLSPDTFPRRFSPDSDLDVAIFDEQLFDLIWTSILKWNYPRRYHLGGLDWEWRKNRSEDVFWGWFRPHTIRFGGLSLPAELKPVRDLSVRWAGAFRSLARYSDFASRNVTGRLYRTLDHTKLYQVEGLRQIRERLKGA